jgi:hypothetical protein
MIKRRHVFLVIGYAPIPPQQQHSWFEKSLAKFGALWNATGQVSGMTPAADGASAWWTAQTQGPNWQVETTYEYLTWHDIIERDFRQSLGSQIVNSFLTLLDFIVTGTLFRYMRWSWKYAMFFLAAYLQTAAAAVIGFAAGYFIARMLAAGAPARIAITLVAGGAMFVALMILAAKRWHMQHLFVDWIFSWQFVRGKRPDMEARLDLFADKLVACAKRAQADEIVIVGHCLGAGLAVDIVSRALDRDRDFLRRGPQICVLTVGATIPKFSLHPAGGRFKRAAERIAAEPAIQWAEYHTRDDAISFYGVDPVTVERIKERVDRKPFVHRAQVHDLLSPETCKRIRVNFMRIHVQPILANELRAAYDYFMIACGPLPFGKITGTKAGPLAYIASDGSVLDAAGAAAPALRPARAGA